MIVSIFNFSNIQKCLMQVKLIKSVCYQNESYDFLIHHI